MIDRQMEKEGRKEGKKKGKEEGRLSLLFIVQKNTPEKQSQI